MATLEGSTIASTYDRLLALPSGGLNGVTLVALTDGNASATCALSVATTSIAISATDKFYLDDGGNTYIFESAADIMDFYVGGVHLLRLNDTNSEVVINEGSADVNFRVEGNGEANLLFCDAGNDRVGIGTNTPTSALHISSGTSPSDADQEIAIVNSGTSLFLGVSDSSADRFTGSSNNFGYLGVTGADGLEFATTNIVRMAITAGGNVGIGRASSVSHLDIYDVGVDNTDYASGNVTGLNNTHTITAGDSDSGDDHKGINNSLEFNDTGESFGEIWGIYSNCQSTETADEECDAIYGAQITAIMAGTHSDVTNIYGLKTTADINGGTVDSNVYGTVNNCDIESGVTLTGSVFGSYIDIDADSSVGGDCTLIRADSYTNVEHILKSYDNPNTTIRVVISAAGQIDAEGTINQSQSLDYAEYFESKDGKQIAIGSTVKLDGDKIVACEEGDSPIGVIRPVGSSSVVGGGQVFHWKEKFAKDDYGADIWENFTITKWSEEITFEEYSKRGKDKTGGAMSGKVTDSKVEGSPDKCYREYKYHSDRLPDGVTVPDDAKVIEIDKPRQKLNSDFDESMEYISREDRDEWHIVGLLGQIPITKGQPVGSWTKMNEVSDNVDMYYVFPQANNNN